MIKKKFMYKSLLFIVLIAFSALNLNAQTKDVQAVSNAVEKLSKAIVNPNRAALESIASDALSYGHSAGKVQNKAEFVEDLLNGPFDFLSVEPTNQTISISGNNAIVRHTFVAKATNAGVPTDIRIGIMMVWRKEGAEWKLFARQAFRL
jgi:ketosteroid isomerase-like protein